MENANDMQKILEQLELNSRKQARYAKLQCLFTLVAAVCFVGILVVALRVLPQVDMVVEQAQDVAVQAQGLADQAAVVLGNLETVTQELAQADLSGMVANVDQLVTSSQDGVAQALEKINTMDIEELNKAIANLSDVVEPLAKLTKVFK